MRELGYVEGRSFVMEPRYAGGKTALMPDQAAELERSGVDVIIAGPFEALQAAKQSTSHVPIIMTPSADPAVTGVVENLTRLRLRPTRRVERVGLRRSLVRG
jgi:ABC-type uncharacterized transport system substrate-binding protein